MCGATGFPVKALDSSWFWLGRVLQAMAEKGRAGVSVCRRQGIWDLVWTYVGLSSSLKMDQHQLFKTAKMVWGGRGGGWGGEC